MKNLALISFVALSAFSTISPKSNNSEAVLVRKKRDNVRENRRKRRSTHWTGQEMGNFPNSEQMISDLANDEDFQANLQEELYLQQQLDSPGRSGYSINATLEQIQTVRKFRQLKTMVMFLQDNAEFGKYCWYGCWCFIDGSNNLHTGYGDPVDRIDHSCMEFSKCYRCLKMDFADFNENLAYQFTATMENGVKTITCNDAHGTKKHGLCSCDRELAINLGENQDLWKKQFNSKLSDFDRRHTCFTPIQDKENADGCCGKYPNRYPYASGGGVRKCCHDKVYSSEYNKCCSHKTVVAHAETCPAP